MSDSKDTKEERIETQEQVPQGSDSLELALLRRRVLWKLDSRYESLGDVAYYAVLTELGYSQFSGFYSCVLFWIEQTLDMQRS
jgi:hypothetical protein